MRTIHPTLFNRLMRLPAGIRTDLLEFLGATPVADAQLERMLRDVDHQMEQSRNADLVEAMA
ncbi:hypothetical protein [Rhodovulum marinum]|uniref:Uncharacterized protein n=1 Tax=Rhodovulum marinum TaxID=320662 RepID=A0A4R2PWN1_9RHOB|nr:hypothetical protein [Rhodovulum marinum]TCP40470.1 hypothetical protein EV662_10780 [Rhodovulum marinum]